MSQLAVAEHHVYYRRPAPIPLAPRTVARQEDHHRYLRTSFRFSPDQLPGMSIIIAAARLPPPPAQSCCAAPHPRRVTAAAASCSFFARASSDATPSRNRKRAEEEEVARSSSSSLWKPLSDLYPRLPCRFCAGAGDVACELCEGRGKFAKGGYHRRNPISAERIVEALVNQVVRASSTPDGSKWTAMEQTFGWRHFRVYSKRRGSGKDWFVEMSATCDESTRFWVNMNNLKERDRWSMGWLQKMEIMKATDKDASLVCKACKGNGRRPCSCASRDPQETVLDIIEV